MDGLMPVNNKPGIIALGIMTAFVGFWMARESSILETNGSLQTTQSRFEEFGTLTGVKHDFWNLPDEDMLGFVKVPAGPFIMGSNPAIDRQAYENERWSTSRRQGSVDVDQFFISRFETTVAQYAAFVEDTGRQIDNAILASPYLPIASITWADAVAYSHWLDAKLQNHQNLPTQLRQALDAGARVMLPTEAQWEKAARGSDGRIYPWGTRFIASKAVHGTSSPAPVGSINCSDCAHGLNDMSGNVWELTRSPLEDYPYNPNDDAQDLSSDALYVMRGGSFSDSPGNIRTAVRGGIDPGAESNTIGFRVVIALP